MIVLGIVLAILVLILLLPLGLKVRYDDAGASVTAMIGPYHLQIIPPKPQKQKKNHPGKLSKEKKRKTEPKPEKQLKQGGSITDFWPFVELGLSFLRAFQRKLLLKELCIKVCFGGKDPAKTAINYGRAQAVLAAVYPHLSSAFRICRQDVDISCDFTRSQMTVYLQLHIRVLVFDMLVLAVVYGVRALKTYLAFVKKRKTVCAAGSPAVSESNNK